MEREIYFVRELIDTYSSRITKLADLEQRILEETRNDESLAVMRFLSSILIR